MASLGRPCDASAIPDGCPASFPSQRCVAGDPETLLGSCTKAADCDDPTAGSGLCLTRDLGFTSVTNFGGTNFTFGNGSADAAGSLLLRQVLDAQVFLGVDVRCSGDGTNANCVGCDGVTPAPAGRIGVNRTATPTLVLPLVNYWTSGSVENIVSQSGAFIDMREVSGSGAIRDLSGGGEHEIAACNAKLQIPTPLNVNLDLQFLTKNVWTPVP